MASRLGEFKTAEAQDNYYKLYDGFLDKHWPVARTELDVDTKFGSTHIRRSGESDGSPVVLIHPTSGSSLGWHSIIDPLSQRHAVYTPDTIGTIGRSVQTAPIESPQDLVQWLDQVLDGLSLSRIHLLGYSEGGWIAGLHAALTDRPERLRSLTMIEPAGAIEKIPGRTLASLVARGALTMTARNKPQAVRDFNTWMNGDIELSDDDIELVLAAFGTFRQRLPNPNRLPDDQLRRITTPTLLLLAEDTRIYDPATVAERAGRLLTNVEIETTPNAGHGLPFQYPNQVTSRVLTFMDTQDKAASRPSDSDT